jgi:hypothetical protein
MAAIGRVYAPNYFITKKEGIGVFLLCSPYPPSNPIYRHEKSRGIFEAKTKVWCHLGVEAPCLFRLLLGSATVECTTLPPSEWVVEVLQLSGTELPTVVASDLDVHFPGMHTVGLQVTFDHLLPGLFYP